MHNLRALGGRTIYALIFLALAALGGSPPRAAEATGMTVSTVKAKNACFTDWLRVSGIVVAREEIFVRPDVEGMQVAQILVEDGALVRVGQPLAHLVRPDWMPGGPAKATVTAPANGALVYRQLPVGLPVSARGEPMFRILRDGEMELQVELPQASLAKVEPGQKARIEMLDGTSLAGVLRLILPEIDPLTQLGHARVQMPADPGAKPGAFATAAIDVGQSCGAVVPLSALLYGPQGAIAQVVRDDRIETRRVSVGLFDGRNAEIREGLAPGDAVVALAGAFLREGDLVKPAP